MECTSSSGTSVVPFTVAGQPDPWYPSTSVGLVPGETVTFLGYVTILDAVGETVTLRAIADSCVGDNDAEAYCRVNESDETNNVSSDLEVGLDVCIWVR